MGVAADVACSSSAERFWLIDAAVAHGICRIGIRKDFIHLDINTAAPQGVMWMY
jgi:hypothetical protein